MNPFLPTTEPWPILTIANWEAKVGAAVSQWRNEANEKGVAPVLGFSGERRTFRLRGEFLEWKISVTTPDSIRPGGERNSQGIIDDIVLALQSWCLSEISSLRVELGTDVMENVAALRACRALLVARGRGVGIPRIVAMISGESRGAWQNSEERLIRATIQALGGLFGLADELEISDSALSFGLGENPTRDEIDHRRKAFTAILQKEARLGWVRDPFAGSFFVEELTGKYLDELRARLPQEFRQQLGELPTGNPPVAEYDSGWPGIPPFIRGPYPSMYGQRPWTIRQYAGFSEAGDTNHFFREALRDGQTGISVAFDLPTHRGYDSDHFRAQGDVGRAGVAIDTVEDMERLFEGIPLDEVSVSMTMNGAVLPILAFFFVVAEEKGVPSEKVSGTIQNDILKEFMVRNTYIYPPEPSMRITTDVMAWLTAHSPRFNSISISGYHMHEAGATAAQELAYTLANGFAYLEAGKAAGLDPERLAKRMSFFWAQGMDHMMETAKLRAARGLWARLLWDAGLRDPKALALRCHCQTSGWSLTQQDPVNNVIRTTLEAFSAVFGHTQSLHTNSLDEALALPSDSAARIARRTQMILRDESGIRKAVDPWGGAEEMETLTRELALEAMELISEIDAHGGMVEAISLRVPQRKIEASASKRQAEIDRGLEKIVGVNHLVGGSEFKAEVRSIDNRAVLKTQKEGLERNRKGRDPERLEAVLRELRLTASTNHGNLLEKAIEAARARATLGEISEALENVFGRYEAKTAVNPGGYVQPMNDSDQSVEIEALLARVRLFEADHGRRPRILVSKIGQDGHDRGAKIVAAAFADFGFEVSLAPLFRTPAEVVRQAIEDDVHIIGISSLAGAHLLLVEELIHLLKASGAGEVKVVVGGIVPEDDVPHLEKLGVGAIFGPGSRLPDCARRVLDLLEFPEEP